MNRGYVYVYQIAGFIDVLQRNGQPGHYPILPNSTAPQHLIDFIATYAERITDNAVNYYESKGISVDLRAVISSAEDA